MIKALKLILGLALGAAIGYGGATLLIWLIELGKEPSAGGVEKEFDWWLMLGCVGLTVLFFVINFFLHVILHEAGHLLFGLLTHYRFVSFRFYKWMIVKEEDGLHWRRFDIAGTMGQCIMTPPADTKDIPYFWYNAGGVLVNLFLTLLAIMLLRSFDCHIVAMTALISMAFVGFFVAALNGTPVSVNGMSNDGHNILLLMRNPENKRHFATSLQSVAALSRGIRMREMPEEWFEDKPLQDPRNMFDMAQRMMWLSRKEDQGAYEEARMIAEEIVAFGEKLAPLFRNEINGERVLLELLTSRRREIIEQLWTKELATYVKTNAKYASGKLAILYAYELLYNHDLDAAAAHRKRLTDNAPKFANPGELKTALDMCQKADECREKEMSQSGENHFL